MILERTTSLDASLEEVFEFFSNPENLAVITPPSLGFVIREKPSRPLAAGDRITYTIRVAGLPVKWVTLISNWDPPRSFTDTQEKGPYRRWIHTHTFRAVAGGVEMHDRVDYALPLGIIGELFGGWWVRRQLKVIFDYRAAKIRETFRSKRA